MKKQFIPKDHSAEIPEFPQKAPQKERGFFFPFFSFSAVSKRIKRRVHHHFEACHTCTVRDTTGSSFHCWVVGLGFFYIIITNPK